MLIDDNLLKKLEKLSTIKIDDDRRDSTKKELQSILEFVNILDELNLKDEKIGSSSNFTPLRDDVPNSGNQEIIDIVFKNAPDAKDGFFVVPKILD